MRDESLLRLREWFPKGSTVYTIIRYVSKSGMSRTIGIVSLACDGDGVTDRHPNHAVSEVLGLRRHKHLDGVTIAGCGTDMGFEIAYRLGQELWGDGYSLKHRWL
jgi:hypothetical protein